MNISGSRMGNEIHWYVAVVLKKPPPKMGGDWPGLIELYLQEGATENIRGDIAFFQGAKETNWFSFTGRVPAETNNPAGIGAINSNEGAYERYATARDGVRAHIQHLRAYIGVPMTWLQEPLRDNRYKAAQDNTIANRGVYAVTWVDLNGLWAVPGTTYGQDIERMYSDFCKAMGLPVR